MSESEKRAAHPEPLNPRLEALEAGLYGLSPAPVILDRDRLMYAAGKASASLRWLWPVMTGVSSLTALILALLLFTRPEPIPRMTERIVYLPLPGKVLDIPPSITSEPSPILSAPEPMGEMPYYRQIQEQILRWDLDGVPAERPSNPEIHENYKMFLRAY